MYLASCLWVLIQADEKGVGMGRNWRVMEGGHGEWALASPRVRRGSYNLGNQLNRVTEQWNNYGKFRKFTRVMKRSVRVTFLYWCFLTNNKKPQIKNGCLETIIQPINKYKKKFIFSICREREMGIQLHVWMYKMCY